MPATSTGQRILTYRQSPTGREFHACDAEIKGLLGPVGSGKSDMVAWCSAGAKPIRDERLL